MSHFCQAKQGETQQSRDGESRHTVGAFILSQGKDICTFFLSQWEEEEIKAGENEGDKNIPFTLHILKDVRCRKNRVIQRRLRALILPPRGARLPVVSSWRADVILSKQSTSEGSGFLRFFYFFFYYLREKREAGGGGGETFEMKEEMLRFLCFTKSLCRRLLTSNEATFIVSSPPLFFSSFFFWREHLLRLSQPSRASRKMSKFGAFLAACILVSKTFQRRWNVPFGCWWDSKA